jgi:hypothetical protein
MLNKYIRYHTDNESLHQHLMRSLIKQQPYDLTITVPKHDNINGNSNRRLLETNIIDQYNRLLSSVGKQYLFEDDLLMVQNDFQSMERG